MRLLDVLTALTKEPRKPIKRVKKISFYRIPAVIRHTDKRDLELSTKRRDGYLAAISRDDLTVDMLEKSDYRVCSEHFVDGEPAKLYEFTKSNWLPTLNLGHTKQRNNTGYARYDRAKRRNDEQRMRGRRPSSHTTNRSSWYGRAWCNNK